MRVLVPFEASDPKTRLDSRLDADERTAFARAMLTDVLDAVREAGHDPHVLATASVDLPAPTAVDDRPLSTAVNDRLAGATPLAVVVADLALVTPGALDRLLSTPGDVALAPGRGGGTNGLVVRHPDFRVDFHGASYRDHRAAAESLGTVGVVDSMRLATDVDEPADLVEVLLHGEGAAAAWVGERFELDVGDGRVGIRRR
ncbi:MAG: 2-phospho-L-lactate guanylyltransferase [Haloplanus sp.]